MTETALSSKFSRDVLDLLENRIDSFEKLEVIVALHRAPRTTMSVDELCRSLKLTRDVVRESVIELRGNSLVALTSTAEVQLLPPTSKDRTAVDDLMRAYEEDRLAVITTMGEIAVARIRNMASRLFADAFVIRRKKDKEDG